MKHKTTIYDIAKYLKISPASVSYVLNGKPKVSQKTKEAVYQAIKDLGYSIDYKGLALSTGKTRIVAVFLPSTNISKSFLGNQFYSEFLGFFNKELYAKDYDVILRPLTDVKTFSNWLRNRSVDCAVFIGKYPEEFHNELNELGIPTVLVDVYGSEKYELPSILTDDEEGIYLATKELILKGHTNIGFLSENINKSLVDLKRFEGYKRALKEFNLPLNDDYVFYCHATYNGGLEISKEIKKHNEMTGLICAADMLAIGVIKGLSQSGIDIPNDLSIIGFDDIQISSLITPSLSTVHQDIEAKAKNAGNLALKLMNKEKIENTRVIIEPTLVIRDSIKNLKI